MFLFQLTLVGGREAGPQSVFELRLKRFHHRAEDKDCAAADVPATNGDGSSATGRRCETKFRVCLKHFMAQVDGSNMCTFGVEVIPMEGRQNDSIQLPPVRFNIGFKWPVRILSALFCLQLRRNSALYLLALCILELQ